MSFVFLSAFAACAVHGAAIMECGGLVTGDTEGWRFEASDAFAAAAEDETRKVLH